METPPLPEGWGEHVWSERTFFGKAGEAMKYCIESYENGWYDVEIANIRWNAIAQFPDFDSARHFAIMYIITQET